MFISALCCTYRRRGLLQRMLQCWELQDYPRDKCELIILDDSGDYPNQQGENWQIVSFPRRFTSLGEKRNASAALANQNADAFAIWDDDDIYLPNAMSTLAHGLESGEWVRPSQVLYLKYDSSQQNYYYQRHETGGLYHGSWAFTRGLFRKVGGYGYESGPEDQKLMYRMEATGTVSVDPLDDNHLPYYVYGQDRNSLHISAYLNGKDNGERAWEVCGAVPSLGSVGPIVGQWDIAYDAVPILPLVHQRPF